MVKIKLNSDSLSSINTLCISILQVVNELLCKSKNIEDSARYKSELYEINCVKDRIEIQRIKMRNQWSKKTISFKLSPTQSYILVYYWSRNKEQINNYNMVILSDLSNNIYQQLTNM